MGFGTRTPTSNAERHESYRWGGDGDLTDATSLLLSGQGGRCAGCQQVAWLKYLREHEGRKMCPDCHPAPPTPAMLSTAERRSFDPTRCGEDGEAD